MPFRGKYKEREIIAPELTDKEWYELKNEMKQSSRELITCETGKKGYLRKSSRGTKHIAHKKGEKPGNWKPESWEHLKTKDIIYKSCINSGWNAMPEKSNKEKTWIADILCWNNKYNKKIAFEVQYSKQTLEETKRRQERYRNDGVVGFWFFKEIPKEENGFEFKGNNTIPIFQIEIDENNEIYVVFNAEKILLSNFIELLLNGHLSFYENTFLQKNNLIDVEFLFYKRPCNKCGEWHYRYWIEPIEQNSMCHREIYFEDNFWEEKLLRFDEDIVREALKISKENKFNLAPISKVFSKTVQKEYYTFFCKSCGAFAGHFFLKKDENSAKKVISFTRTIKINSLSQRPYEDKHWCYKSNHTII